MSEAIHAAIKSDDDYFRDWEGYAFGFGYGTGEPAIIPALWGWLASLKDGRSYDHEDLEAREGKLAAWLLINAMCRVGMLEYGTSPRFGWLTERGERLRDYMLARTADQLLEVLWNDADKVECYPDYCNCDSETRCQNPFWTKAS
ncbi:MAG: hypothetical protein ACYDD1_04935 [Caulobacteraceae bacterium]